MAIKLELLCMKRYYEKNEMLNHGDICNTLKQKRESISKIRKQLFSQGNKKVIQYKNGLSY